MRKKIIVTSCNSHENPAGYQLDDRYLDYTIQKSLLHFPSVTAEQHRGELRCQQRSKHRLVHVCRLQLKNFSSQGR